MATPEQGTIFQSHENVMKLSKLKCALSLPDLFACVMQMHKLCVSNLVYMQCACVPSRISSAPHIDEHFETLSA